MAEAGEAHHFDVMAPVGKRIDHHVRLPNDRIFLAKDHCYPQAATGGFEPFRVSQKRSNHDHARRLENVAPQSRL
jgi:hypothetical protein